MIHRLYDRERDQKDCHRIWREVGWIEKDQGNIMDTFLEGCRVLVGDLNGRPESLAVSSPGSLRYLEQDLPFCAVCGVTTGYAGRKQGLAGRLTAELIALDAAEGALVAGLGMFEQGYYDRLGFGTGSYESWIGFDPSSLKIDIHPPAPIRLTKDDYALVHRSRLMRLQVHGNTTLFREELTQAEMEWSKKGFGLGYMDPDGENLSHHFWCGHVEGENGPYSVSWMSYTDYFQFLELLALIRNLGDQVSLIRLNEPAAIQIQDLIRTPFRHMRKTRKSKFETSHRALAYWQIRICDLEKCMAKTFLPWGSVSFNLEITDPIEEYLAEDAPWRGITGSYIVTLGPESRAEKGHQSGLPVLEASVGAFTRMWFGVRPASGLAVTDDLAGPDDLLKQLDEVLRLPTPSNDWEY